MVRDPNRLRQCNLGWIRVVHGLGPQRSSHVMHCVAAGEHYHAAFVSWPYQLIRDGCHFCQRTGFVILEPFVAVYRERL